MLRPLPAWALYGASLMLPLATLAFLITVPHGPLGWLAVPATFLIVARADRMPPRPGATAARVSRASALAILLATGGLHLANALVLAGVVAEMGLVDAVLAVVLIGIGSAYAAGIVGHELVHQRSRGA